MEHTEEASDEVTARVDTPNDDSGVDTPSGGSGQSLVNQSLIKALRERAAQHQSLGPATARSSEIKTDLTMLSMDGPKLDRLPLGEVKHVEIVRSSAEDALATSPETETVSSTAQSPHALATTTRIQRDCQARFDHDGQMKQTQQAQKTFASQGTSISASTSAPAFSSLRAAASSDLMACVGFSILRVTSEAHGEKGSRIYIANVTPGSDAHGKQLATGMRIKAVNNLDVSYRQGDEVTRLLIGVAGSLSQIRVAAFESSGRPSEDRLVEVAHDCAVPEADSLAAAELKRESTPTARMQVQASREHGPGGAEVEEGEGEMRELIEVLAHERSVRKMTMAEDMIKAPSHHACDADEDKNGDDSLARGFDAARPRAFSRRCPKVAGGHRVGDR